MAHDEKTLTVEAGEWGPDAEHWLSQAVSTAGTLDLRLQAQSGASLFYLRHQAATVGAFLLRVDNTARGPVGVIVAAAGHLQGVDLMDTVMPVIESKFVGCRAIRYHTSKPAVARRMDRRGYRLVELVCIKDTE